MKNKGIPCISESFRTTFDEDKSIYENLQCDRFEVPGCVMVVDDDFYDLLNDLGKNYRYDKDFK
ncbi:hypothetical protein ABFK60_001238 [Escherichia coli O13/129/135:H4]